MNLFNKIRRYFQENKIQRAKKEERKLPKSKGNGKGSRIIVWFILILIILLSPLAFLRAQTALQKSKSVETAVQAMENQEPEMEVGAYSSPMLEVFGEKFVTQYLTIPKSKDDRKEHQEELQTYFAEGISLPDISEFNGFRELNDLALYDLNHQDNLVIMSYLVDYTDTKIKEVKKGKKKKKKTLEEETPVDHVAILNIPVRAHENGGYAVVESPYFSSVPDVVNAEMEKIGNPLAEEEKLSVSQTEEINTWLERFLEDYASNSPEDMTYIMDEPEGLNGLQEFVSVADVEAYPTEVENRYIVKAIAVFKEKDVPITHEENLILVIEREDNKFFVKELKRTLGGK